MKLYEYETLFKALELHVIETASQFNLKSISTVLNSFVEVNNSKDSLANYRALYDHMSHILLFKLKNASNKISSDSSTSKGLSKSNIDDINKYMPSIVVAYSKTQNFNAQLFEVFEHFALSHLE
jgi:hypothetical protein